MTSSVFMVWIIRLIAWDGVLPAVIWSVPSIIAMFLPNRRGPIELIAVTVPVFACVIRFYVGRTSIRGNFCGKWMRRMQIGWLCVGILVLVILDAGMILRPLMPNGAFAGRAGDILMAGIIYSIYFSAMAVAMYPGSSPDSQRITSKTENCHVVAR